MPTCGCAGSSPRSASLRCPCPNAGESTQAWKDSSSAQRVITNQVLRSSVGLSSSKPSKPAWTSTAPARAANRRARSSPLSAVTVIALILMMVIELLPRVDTEGIARFCLLVSVRPLGTVYDAECRIGYPTARSPERSELAVDQPHHLDTPVSKTHLRLAGPQLGHRLLASRGAAHRNGRDVLSQLVVGQHANPDPGRRLVGLNGMGENVQQRQPRTLIIGRGSLHRSIAPDENDPTAFGHRGQDRRGGSEPGDQAILQEVAHAFDDRPPACNDVRRKLHVASQGAGLYPGQARLELPEIIDRRHIGARVPQGFRDRSHPLG